MVYRWSVPRSSTMLIAVFLGEPAITVGRRPHVLHVDVALLVQLAEERLECAERLPDIAFLFVFGVCFVSDLDVEVDAVLPLRRQGFTADDPLVARNKIDRDR